MKDSSRQRRNLQFSGTVCFIPAADFCILTVGALSQRKKFASCPYPRTAIFEA